MPSKESAAEHPNDVGEKLVGSLRKGFIHGFGRVVGPCSFEDARWDANGRASWRNRLRDIRSGRDFGVGSDLDIADHLRAGPDQDAGSNFGVAVGFLRPRPSKRNAMKDRDVVLDHNRLAKRSTTAERSARAASPIELSIKSGSRSMVFRFSAGKEEWPSLLVRFRASASSKPLDVRMPWAASIGLVDVANTALLYRLRQLEPLEAAAGVANAAPSS